MAVFKCKMCGGSLDISDGISVATCEYCGTKQTVPKSRDEVVTNLFNRANNLRLKCEFDKAEQVYEKILDTDNSDAEAHWGVVLCKYGIEYVEDPKTYSRIPTCHRTLYEAVLTDVDYLAAIENADAEQKELYIAEAKIIDELQKNILAIVNSEEPFDVFICYKETDEDGKRTVDSAIANDIHYQLTQEGFKVFYAPITLEDKLGHEYEPYIFAALNSAKVMLVVGTKPEYFDSVWVRNEWSRFIKLTKSDRSKMIIPCYRNMDAYELPDEFAHLQAQDMGKIGFITDVIRGLKKIFNRDESSKYTTIRAEKPVKKKRNKTKSFLVNFKNKFKSNFQLTFKLPRVTAVFYVLTIIFYIYFLIKMGDGVTCGHDFFMFSLMGLPFVPPLLIFTKVIKKKSIAIIIEAITLLWNSIAYFSDIYYQISNGIFQATILMSLLCLIWLIAVCCTKRTEKKQTDNKKWFHHVVAIVLSIIFIVVYDMVAVPFFDYQFAKMFYNSGAYEYAAEYFDYIGDYKDTADYKKELQYIEVESLYKSHQYSEAIFTLRELGNFPDSKGLLKKIRTEMDRIASEEINPTEYIECTVEELYRNPKKYHGKKVSVTSLKVLCNFEDYPWADPHYTALLCESDDTNDGSSTTGNTWYGYYSDYLLPYDIPYVGVQSFGGAYISEGREIITVYGTFTYNTGKSEGDRISGEPHIYNIVADCCIE